MEEKKTYKKTMIPYNSVLHAIFIFLIVAKWYLITPQN